MRGGRLQVATGLAAAALLCSSATALAVGFDDPASDDPGQQLDGGVPFPLPYDNVQRDDTPDDPDYDRAEPDLPDPDPSTNVFSERFDLFGFASHRTRNSARYLDPTGPNFLSGMVSGFNAAGAWKITRGKPSVSVAVLDTGINWDNAGLRTQVRLNADELPQPEPTNNGAPLDGYDLNANGVVDVDDYKDDPRVNKPAPTAQDLIKATGFSNGQDNDGNGYVDDIAGWDFFDDDNDPQDTSSYFAAENHGTGRAEEAVERGNDGEGSIGVCPKCQFVPMRVWDTFVSDQNNFFLAVTYAADNGVKVILGADGGLYHSKFAEQASRYAYEKGVAQLYSGDDLNTGNHNYPAAYNHAMLVQGVAADVEGLGEELPDPGDDDPVGIRDALIGILDGLGAGTSVPTKTFFRNANTTQFGGKSSISMHGPTGSTNTGKAAGAAALVLSAALEHNPPIQLSPDELRALLEQTAEDILPGDTIGAGVPDPAQEGFDTHFGYGRANVGEAAREAAEGRIPPEASIDSPEWYEPLPGDAEVKGLARARGEGFDWKLEYGIGLAPTAWTEVRNASSTGATVTDFGSLPMDDIRTALANRATFPDRDDPGGPTFNPAPGLDPYQGQFTVRLTVAKPGVKPGVHRKVLTALDDPTLRNGFPKRLGAGGEAPLRYGDLNGDNQQELVLPTEDGKVHVYRPDGSELPGWPVQTEVQSSATAHLQSPALQALDPPLEPPRAPTIADLTGDGKPEVITAAGERIYVWDSKGDPLDGWPVRPDPSRANCALSEQEKELKHPKCGFLATPAVARLEGPGEPLDIVVPGLDGRLRAYRPDGTVVPGFPVRLRDPAVPDVEKMTAESINNPAIGDLDGDGRDDIIVATNEVYGGADSSGGDVGFGGLLAAAGSTSRVYAVKSNGTILPGWPVKPGGIIQNVLPLIGPGHDPALVKVGGVQKIVVSVTGSTVITIYNANGTTDKEIQQTAGGLGALNLFESSAVGDLDGGGPGGLNIVKYQLDLGQAANLLLVGQNVPYSHRIGAYDASTGVKAPAFPVITDDYQFLSSSTVARVADGVSNQVLAGTGLGLLHAYDGVTGNDAAGFPKVTGGWLFAPAALSDDGRIAAITREGFLFEWDATDAPACQTEWPSFRHDPQSTGNYDADGTAPGAPDRLGLIARGGSLFRLGFRSPGDDGLCGTATRYVADVDGQPLDLGAPVEGGTTFTKDITLPDGARKVTIRAADGPANAAFNLGAPGVLERSLAGGEGASERFTSVRTTPLPRARLKLKLTYRARRTRSRRRCALNRVRVTVTGADRRLVARARFRVGRRSFFDRRPPLSRVYRDRHIGPSHRHKAKVSVRLKDGRLVRLSKRFRVCAQG
jgi:hypothetical protein